jgi:hypothetical protein
MKPRRVNLRLSVTADFLLAPMGAPSFSRDLSRVPRTAIRLGSLLPLVNQSLPISPQRRRGTAYSRGTNASVALETRSSAVGAAQSTRPRETRALRDLRRVAGAVRDRHLRDLMDGLRGRVTVDLGATFRPALRDAGPCFHIREVTRPTLVSVIVVRAGASHDPGPGLFNLARQLNFDWADDRQFFERSATLFGRSGPPTTPWSRWMPY